jgi:hypothetical protein
MFKLSKLNKILSLSVFLPISLIFTACSSGENYNYATGFSILAPGQKKLTDPIPPINFVVNTEIDSNINIFKLVCQPEKTKIDDYYFFSNNLPAGIKISQNGSLFGIPTLISSFTADIKASAERPNINTSVSININVTAQSANMVNIIQPDNFVSKYTVGESFKDCRFTYQVLPLGSILNSSVTYECANDVLAANGIGFNKTNGTLSAISAFSAASSFTTTFYCVVAGSTISGSEFVCD